MFFTMNRTLRKLKFYGKQCLLPKKVHPPYHHACQIGDPVLRKVTNHVEPELIKTKEFQNVNINIYVIDFKK